MYFERQNAQNYIFFSENLKKKVSVGRVGLPRYVFLWPKQIGQQHLKKVGNLVCSVLFCSAILASG